MRFALPNSQQFLSLAATLKEKYEAKKQELHVKEIKEENEKHLAQITLLENIHQQLKLSELPADYTEEDYKKAVTSGLKA